VIKPLPKCLIADSNRYTRVSAQISSQRPRRYSEPQAKRRSFCAVLSRAKELAEPRPFTSFRAAASGRRAGAIFKAVMTSFFACSRKSRGQKNAARDSIRRPGAAQDRLFNTVRVLAPQDGTPLLRKLSMECHTRRVLRNEFCGNSEVPPVSTPCEKMASSLIFCPALLRGR
jgi:hypothetical protein